MVEFDENKTYVLREFVVKGYPKGNYDWESDNLIILKDWELFGKSRGEIKIRNVFEEASNKKIRFKVTDVNSWTKQWGSSKYIELLPGKAQYLTAIHMGGDRVFIHEFEILEKKEGDFPPPEDLESVWEWIEANWLYIVLLIIILIIIGLMFKVGVFGRVGA